MPFEVRPKVILLENVAALDKKRAVEGHRAVTTLIKEVFDPLGYSCDWATVSAKNFDFRSIGRGSGWSSSSALSSYL